MRPPIDDDLITTRLQRLVIGVVLIAATVGLGILIEHLAAG